MVIHLARRWEKWCDYDYEWSIFKMASCPAGEKRGGCRTVAFPGGWVCRRHFQVNLWSLLLWWSWYYYYDGQNDADDHHYHGDDDRDKDGIWIMNILNRTQFFWLSIMQGWVERGAEGVDFKTEHFRRFWRDCWRDDRDYNGGITNISSSTSLFCQKTPDLSDG